MERKESDSVCMRVTWNGAERDKRRKSCESPLKFYRSESAIMLQNPSLLFLESLGLTALNK